MGTNDTANLSSCSPVPVAEKTGDCAQIDTENRLAGDVVEASNGWETDGAKFEGCVRSATKALHATLERWLQIEKELILPCVPVWLYLVSDRQS